jgi:peptide/nickel transport system substrate-binding protein
MLRPRFSWILGAALAAVAVLAGPALAQGSPVAGGVLRVAIPADPPSIDPHATTSTIVHEINSHLAEMLYASDGDGVIQPMLAAALPVISDDTLTYTIALRQGVLFHDGSTLTADDVVASLQRWQRIGRGKTAIAKVTSIEAPDANTVVLRLSEPLGILTATLGNAEFAPVIYPRAQVEAAGDDPIAEPIGTGPYRFKEWRRGERVVVERFPDYVGLDAPASGDWGMKHAWLDEIHFIAVPDAATRQAGLESGEFDVNYRASGEDVERIEASERMYAWFMRPGYKFLMLLNHQSPLMQDLAFRQAIQATIDAYPVMLGAFGNEALFELSAPIVPPEYGPMSNDAGAEFYDVADPARGAELLAASGYDGTPVRFITTRDFDYQYRGTLVVTDQLAEIGIVSDVTVRDWATTVATRADPTQWDVFIGNFTVAPQPELIPYLSGGYLNGYTGTEAYRALFDELRVTADPARREAIWEEAQALYYADVGVVPLAKAFLVNAYASDVHVEARQFLFQAWNTWKE